VPHLTLVPSGVPGPSKAKLFKIVLKHLLVLDHIGKETYQIFTYREFTRTFHFSTFLASWVPQIL
jgi:hypothetical protein